MALYFYQAYSREGKKISGYLDASTLTAAREQLSRKGIYPIKIEIAQSISSTTPWYKRLFQKNISLRDKLFFTKQLSVLLKSGIPLVQALDLLVDQTEGRLKDIVISLRDGIKEGESLAAGLQKYPGTFDSIFIQLVRAGEATGKLEVILDRLTDYLAKREELSKKISGAFRMPLIQLTVIILVTIGLLVMVVPQVAETFLAMDLKLPLPTRMLTALSDFLTTYYIPLGLSILILVIAFTSFKVTKTGAYFMDSLKLKLPIIGYFSRTSAIVQFCRTLGMLVESGVNLSEALNIVSKIVNNKILAVKLEQAKENIIKQGKISQYLKETGLFPPTAIYLINTGEQSGQLGEMLISVAKYYEDELNEKTDSFTTLLNPIMLGITAGIVGFIMASILLPVKDILNKLKL